MGLQAEVPLCTIKLSPLDAALLQIDSDDLLHLPRTPQVCTHVQASFIQSADIVYVVLLASGHNRSCISYALISKELLGQAPMSSHLFTTPPPPLQFNPSPIHLPPIHPHIQPLSKLAMRVILDPCQLSFIGFMQFFTSLCLLKRCV